VCVCVCVCVQKSMHVTLSFAFSSRYAKTRTSKFRKVRQYIWRYDGKYYADFVANLVLFPAVKEFWISVKNSQSYRHQFRVLYFFATQCI